MKTQDQTTLPGTSDIYDASAVADHKLATDEERTAAAHVIAAYDLRTVCEMADIAIVQSAGQRLKLW